MPAALWLIMTTERGSLWFWDVTESSETAFIWKFVLDEAGAILCAFEREAKDRSAVHLRQPEIPSDVVDDSLLIIFANGEKFNSID